MLATCMFLSDNLAELKLQTSAGILTQVIRVEVEPTDHHCLRICFKFTLPKEQTPPTKVDSGCGTVDRSITSVTRLGDFYKFLTANCLTKQAQICWWHFGLFLIMSLLCIKCMATFWTILWEIRRLFIPSSGHTVGHS